MSYALFRQWTNESALLSRKSDLLKFGLNQSFLDLPMTVRSTSPLLQAWEQFCQDRDLATLQEYCVANFIPALGNPQTVTAERCWQWFQSALPQLQVFFTQRNFPNTWMQPLWSVWLPLACQLQDWHRQAQQSPSPAPQIIGFLGGQGSGKTTLTTLLKDLLELQGYRVMAWSIDDLYLPYADRFALQKRDPRLIWRGPPGTHDVALGCAILQQFKAAQSPVDVPRFDKSCHAGAGDRAGFETVEPVDFVLFEGWMVGVQPLSDQQLGAANLPDPIVSDADRAFAQDMNRALTAYKPLWAQLDRLIVLQLQDYRWSQQWRQQAEQQMRAQGRSGMSDAAIREFVEYFWKSLHPELFITPLTEAGSGVDLVLEIGADHMPDRVYRPAD